MTFKTLILTLLSILTATGAFAQGSDYWQQRAEYRMEIDMDTENHQYAGEQELTYYNNSPDTLRRVFYHLYFNAFQPGSMMDVRSRTIEDPDSRVGDRILHLSDDEIGYQRVRSLTQDGEAVEYVTEGTILEVTLNEPIPPGENTTFEMEWDAQVPLQIRRSGRDNAEGVEFSMSQWYPKISEYDEDGWHPNPYVAREFYGVWGDFEVNITIDASYVMGATGHLQNPEEVGHGYQEEGTEVSHAEGERITWRWRAEDVHDFMWGADPEFTHTTAQVPDGPTLHFFYQTDPVTENDDPEEQEQYLENWRQLPSFTVKAFQFMSENFGEYPWEKFSVIQGGDGGMEYPMGTLITGGRSLGSLVGVTVHELIHMWYYGVLGTNESRYPWMDEGFTTYASALTMNSLFGEDEGNPHSGSYNAYFSIVEDSDQEALDIHADHFHTNRAYGTASYSTGAVFLNQLRYIVGNDVFDRGMKRFFNAWKFKHPDGRDFLRVMERESGMVLDWYYQYFIETTRHIDYGITGVISEGQSTHVTLKRQDLMPMPVELMVTYADGSRELFYLPLRIMRGEKSHAMEGVERTVMADWPWTNPTYTLRIDRPASQIQSLKIDPTERTADINRENNLIQMDSFLMETSDN